MPLVTRFAPSPTGRLHLGHAYAALFAWRRAREAGGRFLLRLEDIDLARCRPEYRDAIAADLAWLGIDWDGEVRVQSEHFAAYRRVLDGLAARGLAYPCFCTRADIAREIVAAADAPHTPDGSPRYAGTCRLLPEAVRRERMAAGMPFALRLDMAAALSAVPLPLSFSERGEGRLVCDPARFGDAVLARKDAPASYHLCVSYDDALQGVTLVTRGLDLRPSTNLQRLLQALMGWPEPCYAHHRLIADESGRRLAKRDRAVTLDALRRDGWTPAAVRRAVGL